MSLAFKVLLLGDSEVGKTSVLRRFLGEEFDPTFISTTPGPDIVKTKSINVRNSKVQLEIWDSPGGETFRTVSATYLKDVKCVLIFFDVSKQDSFTNVQHWFSFVKCYTDGASHGTGISKVLIGNKIDKGRCVPDGQVKHMAEKFDSYHETSAKTSSCDDVTRVFEKIFEDKVEIVNPPIKTDNLRADSFWHKHCIIL